MRKSGTPLMTRAGAGAAALAVGVASLIVVAGAVPASAHASLLRSSPADRSSVATAPKTVTLTFDENIAMPSVIVVTDADGASVVRGKTSVTDNTVSTRVSIAAAGSYTVVYRVVSADGHPVSGRLSFTVGTGSPAGGRGPDGSSDQAATASGQQHESTTTGPSARVMGMIGALALLGGLGLLTVRRWAPNLWSSS